MVEEIVLQNDSEVYDYMAKVAHYMAADTEKRIIIRITDGDEAGRYDYILSKSFDGTWSYSGYRITDRG